jgi:hypothetical protein
MGVLGASKNCGEGSDLTIEFHAFLKNDRVGSNGRGDE